MRKKKKSSFRSTFIQINSLNDRKMIFEDMNFPSTTLNVNSFQYNKHFIDSTHQNSKRLVDCKRKTHCGKIEQCL